MSQRLLQSIQQQPRFTRGQPVWWQHKGNKEPLQATFAYYTRDSHIPVIDVTINERACRKFTSEALLSPREESTSEGKEEEEREQLL